MAGQLTLNVPPFLKIAHDESLQKATVEVEDREVAHQRAMWGEYSSSDQSEMNDFLTAPAVQEPREPTYKTASSESRKGIFAF